ncbi:MAG: Tex-like N-terminal domain-containing protein, partial [Crocinitomicaceae bacterium]
MLQQEFVQTQTTLSERSVKNVLSLLSGGATIPFISRYRKEQTGGLDEVQVAFIRNEAKRYDDIKKKKKTIVSAIEEQ